MSTPLGVTGNTIYEIPLAGKPLVTCPPGNEEIAPGGHARPFPDRPPFPGRATDGADCDRAREEICMASEGGGTLVAYQGHLEGEPAILKRTSRGALAAAVTLVPPLAAAREVRHG